MPNLSEIYFVLGTRAQFIKIAPILKEMAGRNIKYTLIYTAQHRENIQEILDAYLLPPPDNIMYDQMEANTRSSFLRWFIDIFTKVLFKPKQYIPIPGILLTHGDTFTAWIAALLGKRTGCKVGHIESGFRSYNIFSPFPEELSRMVTFFLSDIYFCADEWAISNLKRFKGEKINMGANTMLDGVRYALNLQSDKQYDFQESPYVLVSIHRYENIFTSRLTKVIIPLLKEIANKYHLVFILHPPSRERLQALGLFDELKEFKNLRLHERFDFIEWINICNRADFVITDGGSNQEELSYLGVPTLLFRDRTERQEGIGRNVVLSKFDVEIIEDFVTDPGKYRFPPLFLDVFPSKKIIEVIQAYSKK